MKKNMGTIDRVLRTILALVMIFLYIQGIISGTLGIILIALSVIFLATSLFSFCPLYYPFGIKTCKSKTT